MTAQRPVAIVTGGSAGIGWEIGQRLSADGYRVVATDRVPGLTAGDNPAGILWRELDVTDHAAVDRVFGEIEAELGPIEVLVNNAGIQRHRGIEDLTWDEWSAVVDVNLHGVFSALQAAGRRMLDRGEGRIVNISSISSRGSAGRAPYATTKAAVIGLTSTAGAEWAARGVRVNAVARTAVYSRRVTVMAPSCRGAGSGSTTVAVSTRAIALIRASSRGARRSPP